MTDTRLIDAAAHLGPQDRALLNLWMQRGLSDGSLATLAGMSEESVRARKLDLVEDLCERLDAPPYEVVAALTALGRTPAMQAVASGSGAAPAEAGAPAPGVEARAEAVAPAAEPRAGVEAPRESAPRPSTPPSEVGRGTFAELARSPLPAPLPPLPVVRLRRPWRPPSPKAPISRRTR